LAHNGINITLKVRIKGPHLFRTINNYIDTLPVQHILGEKHFMRHLVT